MKAFEYKDFAREMRTEDLHQIDRDVAVIRKTAKVHGPRLFVEEVDAVRPHAPVDRANYKRSSRVEDIEGGAVFYNFAQYAEIIEDGRRPGARSPPIQVIFEWVKRKHIGSTLIGPVQPTYGPRQQGPGARNPSARVDAVERQQWGIAIQIARAIRGRGLPAHMIIERASVKLDEIIQEELEREFVFWRS